MALVFRLGRRSHAAELHVTYLVILLNILRTKFRLLVIFVL